MVATQTKRADTTDTDFEARLHALVFPQVRAKAPRLIPTMIGFEVIDVDDDETKATGIYAFKVGKQMIFVPVFFNDGHIKGLNLMYLENEDLFVPLDDDWVDYCINRQPFSLGTPMKQDENLDLRSMNPPFQDVAEAFGKQGALESEARCDLGTSLLRFPKSATLQILNTMTSDDEFGRAMLRFYPTTKIAEIADKIVRQKRETRPSADPLPNGGIKVDTKPVALTSDDLNLGGLLVDDKDKEELLQAGVVIHDGRNEDDMTKVYRTTMPQDWFSPTSAGVYSLLTSDGGIEEAVVFTDVVTVGDGYAKCLLAVTKDKSSAACAAHNTMTAVKEFHGEEWNRWFDKLPKMSGIAVEADKKFLIVNSKMEATPVLTMIGKISSGDTTTVYVRQDDYVRTENSGMYSNGPCSIGPKSYYGLNSSGDYRDEISMKHENERTPFLENYVQKELDKGGKTEAQLEDWNYKRGRRVLVVKSSDNDIMQVAGNSLIVGANCRVLTVSDNDAQLIAPCNTSIWPYIKQAAGGEVRKLTVTSDRGEYEVKCGAVHMDRGSRRDAYVHLVCVHGIGKAAAQSMLKDAELAETHKTASAGFAIKHAASYPDLDVSANGQNGDYGISESITQVPNEEGAGDPFLTNDAQNVMQAAQSGQKSVFDTTVLVTLLRRHDVGAAINEMLGDLTVGMDRLGRILFLLYSHRDQFEENYGQEDVPQLEDSLENLMKETGETLLFLKKKSIESEAGVQEPEGLLAPQ